MVYLVPYERVTKVIRNSGARCNKGQNNVLRVTNVMGIGHKRKKRLLLCCM